MWGEREREWLNGPKGGSTTIEIRTGLTLDRRRASVRRADVIL